MTYDLILAFDYGKKRIGVAMGTTALRDAKALQTLTTATWTTELPKLVAEWAPTQFVVGLPTYLDGKPHAMTTMATEFGRALEKRFGKPVIFVDETLSTQAAQSLLDESEIPGRKKRDIRDAVAAQVILQAYFDSN